MASTTEPRRASGTFRSTNALLEIRTVGFKPKKVTLFNKTSLASLEWTDQLPDAYGIKQVAAGTTTLEAAAGVTPLAGENPGFSVGAMVDLNDTTTEDVIWEAFG